MFCCLAVGGHGLGGVRGCCGERESSQESPPPLEEAAAVLGGPGSQADLRLLGSASEADSRPCGQQGNLHCC